VPAGLDVQPLRWARMSAGPDPRYVLRLYVTDATPKSARAIVDARRLLEAHLRDRYTLEILDIADNVAQATEDEIVCAPTLLRLAPPPARRIIGDMSDVARVLEGLAVQAG
jgi:circadian clock protein KaiB